MHDGRCPEIPNGGALHRDAFAHPLEGERVTQCAALVEGNHLAGLLVGERCGAGKTREACLGDEVVEALVVHQEDGAHARVGA